MLGCIEKGSGTQNYAPNLTFDAKLSHKLERYSIGIRGICLSIRGTDQAYLKSRLHYLDLRGIYLSNPGASWASIAFF